MLDFLVLLMDSKSSIIFVYSRIREVTLKSVYIYDMA